MTISTVKKQLKQMVADDQEARQAFPKKQAGIDELTQKHADIMAEIIDYYGVIDLERFDEESARNAAIIVQHSPLAIKQKYLELQEAFDQDKIFKRGYAYLKDRLLVAENKPQLYATQMKVLNEQGDLAFNPIADIPQLDARRSAMDLEPFAEYLANIEKSLGKKPAILESV